ncbi:MAG: hypothetical protein ABW072_18895 [Sedimenticola sp.]
MNKVLKTREPHEPIVLRTKDGDIRELQKEPIITPRYIPSLEDDNGRRFEVTVTRYDVRSDQYTGQREDGGMVIFTLENVMSLREQKNGS